MIGVTQLIADILNYEAEGLEAGYTEQLQAAATAAEWPIIVVTQLSIGIRDGRWAIDYPDSIREQVELLEYGTQVTPPNPVLRDFLATLPARERM